MASLVQLVRKNIIWRISKITPTSAISARLFVEHDRAHQRPADMSSGTSRGFYVQYLRGGQVLETSNMITRERFHYFEVVVAYSNKRGLTDFHDLMISDSFDIVGSLRQDDTWTGYDDSHTTTDVGIQNRVLEGEAVEDNGENTFFLRQTWEHLIQETE